MKVLHKFISVSTLLLSVAASANTYVKWNTTDQAVYVDKFGQSISATVTASQGDGWNKYSHFLGSRERWVWSSATSESVYVYNDSRRINEKLVNFNDAVGKRYSVALDACTSTAILAEKDLTLNTAAGQFSQVVRMEFSGSCADGGLLQAWFAPEVGVIQWSSQSIRGPVEYTLAHGVVAGKQYPLADLRITTDWPRSHLVLTNDATVTVGMTVHNQSNSDLTFQFNSAQEFDITLRDSSGKVLKVWSEDKDFAASLHEVKVAAGASHRFGGAFSLRLANGLLPDVGTYLLSIELKGTHAPTATAFAPAVLKAEAPLFIDRRMSTF